MTPDAADAYFERNRAGMDASRPPSQSTLLIASFIKPGDRVLEIGCANGYRLEQLRLLAECECWGVDISRAAIDDGTMKYRQVTMFMAATPRIDFKPDGLFNVVITGFMLYVLNRHDLTATVAECDRLLAPNGKLVVTDFDPAYPHARANKHEPGTFVYKMDYPKLWLANPQYALAGKIAFTEHLHAFCDDADQRLATSVLVKQAVETAYPERVVA